MLFIDRRYIPWERLCVCFPSRKGLEKGYTCGVTLDSAKGL